MPSPESPEPAAETPEPSSRAAGPSPLASGRVRIVLGLVVLAVLLGLCAALLQWWTFGRFMQATNDAFLQADQVTVAPKVAGYVEAVLVTENQEVAAGAPLARIDVRDSAARLDQSLAQVDQGLAAVAQGQAQIRAQQAAVDQARAQLTGLSASAAFARRQVARYEPLAAAGAEPDERLDQLRQNRDQTAAQVRAAEAQLVGAQRQIDILRAQIGLARAQARAARAQSAQARNAVDDADLRAPIAGRVGDLTVRQGQFVQPGVRLMTLVPTRAIYLTANFKETQIGAMRPGQPVSVRLDALPDARLQGVVDSFAPGTGAQFALIPPDNATGNFTRIVQRVPVRIRLQLPSRLAPVLVPGLSAQVVVDTRGAGAAR